MEFAEVYDCQIHYQYLYDGNQKKYYPVIINLHLTDEVIKLHEFDKYPIITFHSCNLQNVTIVTARLRDLNFQECEISSINLEIDEFNGTLGFANSTVSLQLISTRSSPQIVALVESVIIGLHDPRLEGFDLHTLAIISSSLDYLDLDPLLHQVNIDQLILSDISPSLPISFHLPSNLQSLKLKNLQLHKLPPFSGKLLLESLHLEGIDIMSYHHDLEDLDELHNLKQLYVTRTNIEYLPDFSLDSLEYIALNRNIQVNAKLQARLKLAGLRIDLLD